MNDVSEAKKIVQSILNLDKLHLSKTAATAFKFQSQWETTLDLSIAKVRRSFVSHLNSLGCNGSLDIIKQGRVSDWYLELNVGFRQDGILHVLDTQRQSGGERAITTISFFLALQSVIGLPFRVVDEINQGMDEINERWAHARILGAVSHGRMAQLFLITPKLLQELEYGRNSTVHIIYTGDWMQASIGVTRN